MKEVLSFIINRLNEIDINRNHPSNCRCKLCEDYIYIKKLVKELDKE